MLVLKHIMIVGRKEKEWSEKDSVRHNEWFRASATNNQTRQNQTALPISYHLPHFTKQIFMSPNTTDK
jgi:hypothetical protein